MAKSNKKNIPVNSKCADHLTLDDAFEMAIKLCNLDRTSLRSEVEDALKEQYDIDLQQLLKLMRPMILMTPLSMNEKNGRCFHAFVKYDGNYANTEIVSIIDVNLP